MKILLACVAGIILLGSANAAIAATVSPTSASTTGTEFFPTLPQSDLNFVIDGVIDFDQWIALTVTGADTIRFVLPGTQDLSGVNMWNNGGYIEFDGEGIDSFTFNFFDPLLISVGSFGGNFTDTLAMQTIGFSVANVAFVDLVINSSHGAPYSLFHEISFNTAPVPLPPAMLLLGSALAMVGFIGRRKPR